MRKLLIIIPFLALLASACTIHQVDVQQGNVVTKEMVDQLTIGMTTRQVRFLLGNPLLEDPFHENRWDYLYFLNPGAPGVANTTRRITVYFEDDRVVRVETRFPEANNG